MTIEQRISDDLAIVARTSRARPPVLEDTLRAAGALPRATQPPTTSMNGVALLELSRVYVARVARTAAGIVLLVCTISLLAWCALPHGNGVSELVFNDLLHTSKLWVAMLILGIAACAYAIFSHVAMRVVLADQVAARQRLERVGSFSSGASISGVMAFLLFFGMMQAVLGGSELQYVRFIHEYDSLYEWNLITTVAIVLVGTAILVSTAAACVIVRRGSPLSRTSIALAVIVLVGTIAIGLAYDAGPLTEFGMMYSKSAYPSTLFRAVLTTTGTLSLLVLTSAAVLAIKRREDRVLAQYSS